jgi:signal transduction histidine kinase
MSPEQDDPVREIERLKRRLERERAIRLQAESIAEKGLRDLYERQQQLSLLARIAAFSNGAHSVNEALQFALSELCVFNMWDLGHALFAVGAGDAQRLVSAKVWHGAEAEHIDIFRGISESTEFAPGIGLPGLVLASKKPLWVTDLGNEANFPRLKFARECGLKAAAAFPVMSGDTVVAVLEFFAIAVREPNEALLEIMAQIGLQLGRVIERCRAEEVLKEQTSALMRARDDAKAADRMKSAFLATISHELRTPLNAIIGFSEIMKGEIFGGIGNNQYRNYAADIFASGKHLLGIINDVLDFSRLDANALDLREEYIDPVQAIDGCVQFLQPQAQKAGIALNAKHGDESIRLLTDEKRLRQILINLLSNAVKFTHDGGNVSVSLERSELGLSIAITDTGIGMSQTEISHAFERFAQIDSRLNRKYDGTGLGLPLAKKLVELHGGSLHIESEPKAGTTVTVTFPRTRVLAGAEVEAAASFQI